MGWAESGQNITGTQAASQFETAKQTQKRAETALAPGCAKHCDDASFQYPCLTRAKNAARRKSNKFPTGVAVLRTPRPTAPPVNTSLPHQLTNARGQTCWALLCCVVGSVGHGCVHPTSGRAINSQQVCPAVLCCGQTPFCKALVCTPTPYICPCPCLWSRSSSISSSACSHEPCPHPEPWPWPAPDPLAWPTGCAWPTWPMGSLQALR